MRLLMLLVLYELLVFGGRHVVCGFEQALEIAGVGKAGLFGNGLYGIVRMILQFCQGMLQPQVGDVLRERFPGIFLQHLSEPVLVDGETFQHILS